jgi:hypothetical protein
MILELRLFFVPGSLTRDNAGKQSPLTRTWQRHKSELTTFQTPPHLQMDKPFRPVFHIAIHFLGALIIRSNHNLSARGIPARVYNSGRTNLHYCAPRNIAMTNSSLCARKGDQRLTYFDAKRRCDALRRRNAVVGWQKGIVKAAVASSVGSVVQRMKLKGSDFLGCGLDYYKSSWHLPSHAFVLSIFACIYRSLTRLRPYTSHPLASPAIVITTTPLQP